MRRMVRILIGAAFFPAVLFLSAWRIDWLEAWAFVLFFYASMAALRIWLSRHDRSLMNERISSAPNIEKWDRVLMGIYPVLLLTMLVVTALDAGRFKWSSTPFAVRIFGWLALGAALALVWWVLSANPFASRFVRIQNDRGQCVADKGPYRYVRHPMYVGTILFCMCLPMALGSWWGVVPGTGCAGLFVIRTALEDQTLIEKLPGYREYTSRVRNRLMPGVW
jgi:protein-S-isoprenylcysteine O-methyltransferase Ste14